MSQPKISNFRHKLLTDIRKLFVSNWRYDMTRFHDYHGTLFNPNMRSIIIETIFNLHCNWIFHKFLMVLYKKISELQVKRYSYAYQRVWEEINIPDLFLKWSSDRDWNFENFLILKFKYIFEKLSLMWFLLIYVAQVQTALRLSSNWVLLMTTPYFVFWKRRNGEKENL